MTTTSHTPTNTEFADKIGLHHTMASRLRNGERSPSIQTFIAVKRAYGLTCEQVDAWLDAIARGNEASGVWLRKEIFGATKTLPADGQ
jgi:transcriptional regulator with XRE-family HTH domain